MPRHQDTAGPAREPDELRGLFRARRQRLLDEDVLAELRAPATRARNGSTPESRSQPPRPGRRRERRGTTSSSRPPGTGAETAPAARSAGRRSGRPRPRPSRRGCGAGSGPSSRARRRRRERGSTLIASPSGGSSATASAGGAARRSPSDQLRAYATSMSSASPNVECARAFTCQRPVMPAGTENRS